MITISPTAVTKYRTCKRLFAFEYNEKFYPPSSPAQQFGTNVHAVLQAWLSSGVALPDTSEGRVAQQGLTWLPSPSGQLLLEKEFMFEVLSGVSFSGFIDCIAPPGVCAPEPLLIDHKTTSDLRWAKTEEQLQSDPQALIYSMWAMFEFGVSTVKARWVYYSASGPAASKTPRGARPVEVTFVSSDAGFLREVGRLLDDARDMAGIRERKSGGLAFAPSPQSCDLFFGCPHQHRCSLQPEDRLAAYLDQDTVV